MKKAFLLSILSIALVAIALAGDEPWFVLLGLLLLFIGVGNQIKSLDDLMEGKISDISFFSKSAVEPAEKEEKEKSGHQCQWPHLIIGGEDYGEYIPGSSYKICSNCQMAVGSNKSCPKCGQPM